MAIEIDSQPPGPEWPEGVTVRNFLPGQDERAVYETVAEAFQDHWGYLQPTFESWQREWFKDRFDPSLWWLAFDGEELAGTALCTYLIDMGWVRSLAVRRPWRGRGLGTALLHAAFADFYRRGKRKVGLGVDSQNLTGATRLYERAGMRVVRQFDQYRKVLRPGRDLTAQEDTG